MQIVIAGRIIEVRLLYKETSLLLKDYIAPCNYAAPDYTINLTYEDILAEQAITKLGSRLTLASREVAFFNRQKHEFLAIHRKIAEIMPRFDTFLMHGAVVARNGRAFMFTAPSGVGKTTRLKLWMDLYPDSIVVNGDKPLISVTEDEVLACGTPWCGKEGWNTNVMVPLQAIYFLERAAKDSVDKMSFNEAFPFMMQQVYRPSDEKLFCKTIRLLKALDGKVQFYRFCSSPTTESIRMAYEKANYEG